MHRLHLRYTRNVSCFHDRMDEAACLEANSYRHTRHTHRAITHLSHIARRTAYRVTRSIGIQDRAHLALYLLIHSGHSSVASRPTLRHLSHRPRESPHTRLGTCLYLAMDPALIWHLSILRRLTNRARREECPEAKPRPHKQFTSSQALEALPVLLLSSAA